MTSTPRKTKESNLNTSLTPVRFLQSPAPHDSNLVVCKTRLETLIKNLQDNYSKWKLAQQRGTALCYSIEAKKTRCLASQTEDGIYPDDMRTACDKLAVITSIFVDITSNTRNILKQMRALSKLLGASNAEEIFYRSWSLRHFVAFVEELLQRYEMESSLKQQIMQNIAHSKQRSDLIAWTTSWEFPTHVDAFVNLAFILLAKEVQQQ